MGIVDRDGASGQLLGQEGMVDADIHELEIWYADLVQANIDATRRHKEGNPGSESDHVIVQRPPGYYADAVSPIVGDTIHNLRSALDFIASAIVSAGGDNPERPPMYFPMNETRQALISSAEYRRIERVAPDLALLIADEIRPYKDTNYQLWALNRVDRMDKHRILVPTVMRSYHVVVGIREDQENDPPPVAPGTLYSVGGLRAADGTVIGGPRSPRPGTKSYIHNQNSGFPGIEISFAKGEPFQGLSILPTLKQLAELVTGYVDTLQTHVERGEGEAS
jgi:hypothetical protein